MLYSIVALALGVSIDHKLATLSEKMVSAQSSTDKTTMSCSIYGDPHVRGFDGETKCDLFGLGLFPLVSLPGFIAQGFHCPPPLQQKTSTGGYKNLKPSFLAASALKIGNDVVTLVGHDLKVNGNLIPITATKKTQVLGKLTISTKFVAKKNVTHVSIGGEHSYRVKLLAIDARDHQKMATGTVSAFYASSTKLETQGYCASACNVKPDGRIASVKKQNAVPLLTAADLDQLHSECGAMEDDAIYCKDEPSASNVCNAANISSDAAFLACKNACSCADGDGLAKCQYDYCQLNADESALEACADENQCATDTIG